MFAKEMEKAPQFGSTGSWRVDRAEDDTVYVRIIDDLTPTENDAFGWRITLDDTDRITVTGVAGVPVQLVRQ